MASNIMKDTLLARDFSLVLLLSRLAISWHWPDANNDVKDEETRTDVLSDSDHENDDCSDVHSIFDSSNGVNTVCCRFFDNDNDNDNDSAMNDGSHWFGEKCNMDDNNGNENDLVVSPTQKLNTNDKAQGKEVKGKYTITLSTNNMDGVGSELSNQLHSGGSTSKQYQLVSESTAATAVAAQPHITKREKARKVKAKLFFKRRTTNPKNKGKKRVFPQISLTHAEKKIIVLQTKWSENFEELIFYKEKYGNTNVPPIFRDNPSLGNFVMTQRSYYKKAKLHQDRMKQLDSIGFVWDLWMMKWIDMYQRLLVYQKEHKHIRVPQSYKDKDRVPLGTWVSKQRIKIKKGKLDSEKKEDT